MSLQLFEGPEKKVELVLRSGFAPLRSFGVERWNAVVAAADAQVLSRKAYVEFDAYLLAESSLFVYDHALTMITCGRTRLVNAVFELLRFIPADEVALLVYERKNENFPEHQRTSFNDDAQALNARLPGAAVRLGTADEHAVRVFHTTKPYAPTADDTTLEVLMHGIDPEVAKHFCGQFGKGTRGTVARQAGIDALFCGAEIDDFAFAPAGYSLNAARGHEYFTIHVTPDRVGSYVSFETNADFRHDPSGVVNAVVDRFRPESFDVVAFVPTAEPLAVTIPGYHLRQHVQEPLAGYQVTFQHFYRPVTGPSRAEPILLY
jgi:S-adenosylmethionine decarboxylase